MVKHLPFPSACIIHVLSLLFLPVTVLPFAMNLAFPILWLPLVAITFLWLSDLILFVLSLIVWWNVPIQISDEGIVSKNGQIHRWRDAVKFFGKEGPSTIYGRLYFIATISYSDGSTIRFEMSSPLIRSVQSHCCETEFLVAFNSLLEE